MLLRYHGMSSPLIRTATKLSSLDSSSSSKNIAAHFTDPTTVNWVQKILDSYKAELGSELILDRSELSPEHQAKIIAASNSLAIASHDFLRDPADPTFNYGNDIFLESFGYQWEEFVELPSRSCVSNDDEVNERQKILDRVKERKVKSGETAYENLIRVRKDGRKIMLRGVTLWNVFEDAMEEGHLIAVDLGEKKPIGQAVTIEHVLYLDD